MMLSLPPTPPEADAAKLPKPFATASEPGKDRAVRHPFASLLVPGEPANGETLPPGEDVALASALEDALAEALIAAPEAGKLLPPVGEPLPPALSGRGPAVGPGGEPGPVADSPLTRMIDMARTVHDPARPTAGEGEKPEPLQPELRARELGEPARLPPAATGAQLQALASTAAAAAGKTPGAAATPPSVPIAVLPGRPGWSEAVGQRVLWMVSNNSQVAELRLNPPELGPVEVKVRTDDDGVRLNFAAGNAAVREALEAAAPRLREMLLAEGLRLENMDFGQQQAGAGQRSDPEATASRGGAGDDDVDAPPRPAAPSHTGLVDCFV